MEWVELEPIVKVVPRVQAATYVNKDGKPRIRLTLSEGFLNDIKRAKLVNIQVGSQDGVAKLRMVFGKDGKFSISPLGRGGSRISSIPSVALCPDGAREVEPCEVESVSTAEAIIVLPLAAWQKQLAPAVLPKAVAAEQASRAAQETRRAPDVPITSGKFDAVAYLNHKGIKITRDKDGAYREGSATRTKTDILTTVNRYRRIASLPLLDLADLA